MSDPAPAAILRLARKLIEKPRAWTKGAPAKDKRGEFVSPMDKRAVCWCALGAVERIARAIGSKSDVENSAHYFLYCAIRTSIAEYNDTHTHKQILGRFDRAIALAEGK
jgi:hypothetical protein